MQQKNSILHHAQLKNKRVLLDGTLFFAQENAETFAIFAKALYTHLALKYPKFYRMDELSKLGFLTFECLLKKIPHFEALNLEKTGLFLANLNSSLQTDHKYHATTQNAEDHPSPSLFVYTLPNIVIGEICIRHKIKGEHGFFVFEELDTDFLSHYVNDLMNAGKLNACVIGWIESFSENPVANFLWIEKGEGKTLNTENLKLVAD